MARKQFVSSRKNVSSGGLSSKEAALHGRTNLSNGTHPDESSDIEDGSIKEDGAVDSEMSSVPSSPISSEDGAVTDENTPMTAGDDADDLDASVQVVSAGVGRGKQLRFPTLISRGKESRVLFNGSDREGSDSESYASVASDEEEDNVDEDDPIDEETEEATTIQGTTSNHAQVESSPSVTTKQLDEDTVVCSYPIKAIRARKRHRPDSRYFRRMSTHVRDCLLSVRDTASAADVLREATHLEFRRKIENGKVERVEWREASPPRTSTSDTRTSTDVIEKEKPRKRDKPREEKRRDDTEGTSREEKRRDDTVSTDIKSKLQNEDSGERKKTESLAKTKTNGQISCVQCQHTSKTRDDSFIIPPPTVMMDVKILRDKAAKLYEEARSLKHAGNDQGKSIPGSMGQIAQGKYYLRSSVKFFEQALVFADAKLAYRELKDDLHARQFGENCVKTLAQTSTLIESTIRTFQSAGSTKFVALGYKLAAIVHLTIYRFQHLKLFSLYSDLFTPGRSPDTRQSGTTPPVGGIDSSQELVKSHLLKEMEHTLRGFEMWRRYETCKVIVLPRITNPAVIHFNHLFEDFQAELDA